MSWSYPGGRRRVKAPIISATASRAINKARVEAAKAPSDVIREGYEMYRNGASIADVAAHFGKTPEQLNGIAVLIESDARRVQ